MKRWLLALVAVNLIGLLALVFIFPHLMVSPGALIDGHAHLATDCFACHAPLRGASSQRCVICHAVTDIGLRTTQGTPVAQKTHKTPFHQELIEQDCMACHSDHQAPRLTQRSRKSFSHVLLRASVRDRCEACHKAPTDNLHRQITGNCLQCHRQEQWKPATFEHDKLFLLDRDHNATCVTCHVNNDYIRYTCYGCHEHQPDKIRRKHEKEGIPNFDKCVECHRSAQEEPQERRSREGRRRD